MAIIDVFSQIDMHQITPWYGIVESYSSTAIVVDRSPFQKIYRGNFSYDSYGNVYGILTAYETYYNGRMTIDASGLNVSANYAYQLIEGGDSQGFVQYALAGNDTFRINANIIITGDRVIDGFGGINTLIEPFAYHQYGVSSYGGATSITYGIYQDTLYNIQTVTFSDGTYDTATGAFTFTARRTGGDFSGDNKADVLWRQVNGATYVWSMDGARVAGGGAPPAVDPSWVVAAAADFTQDGRSDILWRNSNTGAVNLWAMNGSQVAGNSWLGTVGLDWTIQGVGDFSGNGNSDVLWRNQNGAVVLWQMNGAQVAAAPYVGTVDPGWAIKGVGDFNGDGKSDILWRNSSTGAVNLWTMSGSDIVSNSYIATVSNDWNIQFLADFNGDGKTDVLWRQDGGAVDLWTMAGANVTGNDFVGTVGTDWKIAGAADYTGDGKSDILWRNSTGGAVNIWAMNGSQVTANSYIGTVDNSWSIQHV